MKITQKIIQSDIVSFRRRIADAKAKMAALPDGHLPYPEHKKREKKKVDLIAEVAHVERLIQVAQEGLRDLTGADFNN